MALSEDELSKLVNLPSDKLVEACHDPKVFWQVASILVNIGIKLGRADAYESYNRMFRNYNGISIEN